MTNCGTSCIDVTLSFDDKIHFETTENFKTSKGMQQFTFKVLVKDGLVELFVVNQDKEKTFYCQIESYVVDRKRFRQSIRIAYNQELPPQKETEAGTKTIHWLQNTCLTKAENDLMKKGRLGRFFVKLILVIDKVREGRYLGNEGDY